ncbi:MAG: glycogen synthase GlgA [Candidatus Omnitrophica bacterium]|nr:glycogen synthase GlgA [Candidatus Omnitrophota bacterium]
MTVCMLVSEMEPFAKTGGLADVTGALPPALGRKGIDVHLFLPRYASLLKQKSPVKPHKNVTVHLIGHPFFSGRAGLYGDSKGDYPDNLERFGFFCRQALLTMRLKRIRPDILHVHDWQGAPGIVYLKGGWGTDPFFCATRTVLTIHNLAYQGIFPRNRYPRLEIPGALFHLHGLEFYGKINLLKGGLQFADAVTTVSPTYAREIQTSEQGAGLDGVLRMRARDVTGILNGLDPQAWNPASDRALAVPFDRGCVERKRTNKEALQKEWGLPVSGDVFLVGMVTRLASQKGLDLVAAALPGMESMKMQLVILGSGDRPIEEAVMKAVRGRSFAAVRFVFDDSLARRIYAGADAFLMPSRYEPCGLGQMIAMRYGTVPVVRATGGLADTVTDASDREKGNGFTFGPALPEELLKALRRAYDCYRHSDEWAVLQRRGMEADFSWDVAADKYAAIYRQAGRQPLFPEPS